VAVVGGGIAGLAAAWELVTGSDADHASAPVVHVLESSDRIGGKLRSAGFAGRTVDLSADAFLARRPEATELCEELGLTGQLDAVGAAGASIWARGRLRAMPGGLSLGVPTRWWPLARSGILSPLESLRAAKDLVVPRFGGGGAVGDRSVGDIVGERLGRPVVERLVDPLIGGIHAGGVDDLSAAATFPLLIGASHQPGSLMHRLGRSHTAPTWDSDPQDAAPPFWSLTGSTASLAELLAEALVARGVSIHTDTQVEAIEDGRPTGVGLSPRWHLALGGAGRSVGRSTGRSAGSADSADGTADGADGAAERVRSLEVDGIVLAVPSAESAVLLAPHAPVAAGMLSTIEYASVAVVTLSVPAGAIGAPLAGTGFLVPRTSMIDDRPALITGCTYLGRKWPRLARPGDELVRVSVGRFGDERHRGLDDDELCASAFGELATVLDIGGTPLESQVTRWDGAFPQYRVGHLIRVAMIEQEVARLDGLAVAGAAYRGVGIPACIGSGREAARRVLDSLSGCGEVGGVGPGGAGAGGADVAGAPSDGSGPER
jgi:oxygen-dependent protoporphyrinogen oxidase